MKALEFLSLVPTVILDNFNRDSSACRSRAGVVIHSGVHRSTAFVSRADAVASLEWSRDLGQQALNGWVEATIAGSTLEDCEQTALVRQFPAWKFSTLRNGGACRNSHKQAILTKGRFQAIVSAGSWQDLAKRLK